MTTSCVIAAELTEPPSSVGAIRTVLLFLVTFKGFRPVFAVPFEQRDAYWEWLRRNYLLDFGKDVVFQGDPIEARVLMCNRADVWSEWDEGEWERIIEIKSVAEHNVQTVINRLS